MNVAMAMSMAAAAGRATAPAVRDVRLLNAFLAAALRKRRLELRGTAFAWRWESGGNIAFDAPFWPIVLAAAELLASTTDADSRVWWTGMRLAIPRYAPQSAPALVQYAGLPQSREGAALLRTRSRNRRPDLLTETAVVYNHTVIEPHGYEHSCLRSPRRHVSRAC